MSFHTLPITNVRSIASSRPWRNSSISSSPWMSDTSASTIESLRDAVGGSCGRGALRVEEPEARRRRSGLPAGSDVELAQDRGDMMVDRLRADDQPFGDLRVA